MNIALYPGTFDPFTKGHLDITLRAAKQFDKIIVLVSDHSKKKTLFTLEQRIQFVKEAVKEAGANNVEVDTFNNLMADYAKEKGACVVIRGLRVTSDFEYEFKMAQFNNEMNPETEFVYLMSNASNLHISSSSVKEIASLGGDVTAYVPTTVNAALKKVFA